MQRVKRAKKTNCVLMLLLLYVVCVVVRFLIAMGTRHSPTVSIDEFLYYSLGRSIATEGSLLFHGQPANYNYILYPLMLAPVYGLLPYGTNYFRMIQLWNSMLMSLSVFPLYGICNAMLQDRKKSICLTALFMLFPSFLLSEYIYSEAILYPLFFTLIYCAYRHLKVPEMKYSIGIGILGALLYYTKPGAIVPATLFLLFFAAKAMKEKVKKQGLYALIGIACLAVVLAGMKLITDQVLGYKGSLLSVYDEQATFYQDVNHEYFFRSAGQYPYYFIMACGILPFILSLWRINNLEKEDRQFYLLMIISVLITMIGTAWVVNRPERKDILYLRYVEMYIPIFFGYCILTGTKKKEETVEYPTKPIRILCVLLLGYIVICTAIWGTTTGAVEAPHYLISLSALFIKRIKGTADILVYCFCGGALYFLYRKTTPQMIAKFCLGIFALFALINNIQGYVAAADNSDSMLADETMGIHQIIGDTEYLHVYTEDVSDYGLDVNSRKNIVQVTSDEFLKNIQTNQGTYVPFIPHSVRGMTAAYETPDTDLIIIDEKAYPCIQFSRNTYTWRSTDNSFTVLRFSRGAQIADAVISYSNYPTIDKYAAGRLKLYDEELVGQPAILRLEIDNTVEQNLEIQSADTITVKLEEGKYWYEIELDQLSEEYIFTVSDEEIQLLHFEIVRK